MKDEVRLRMLEFKVLKMAKGVPACYHARGKPCPDPANHKVITLWLRDLRRKCLSFKLHSSGRRKMRRHGR